MNLARRILEGIHEVELEITPEFKQPAKPLNVSDVSALLNRLEWKADPGHVVAAPKSEYGPSEYVYRRKWSHVDVPGTVLVVTQPGEFVPSGQYHPESFVSEVYTWTAAWGRSPVEDLSLESIAKRVQELVAKHGVLPKSQQGEDEPDGDTDAWEVSELNSMIKQLGWNITSASKAKAGRRVLIFTHPKLTSINISVAHAVDNGDIIEAKIVKPGMVTSLVPPSPGHVYKKVQDLMKSQGL